MSKVDDTDVWHFVGYMCLIAAGMLIHPYAVAIAFIILFLIFASYECKSVG